MIVNDNAVTLANSGGLQIAKTYFCAHTTEISNNAETSVRVRAQLDFFSEPVQMFQSPTNRLKIEGFDGDKKTLIFDYFVEVINGHYVLDLYSFDLKVKERLLSSFPSFNPDLLTITTEPIPE